MPGQERLGRVLRPIVFALAAFGLLFVVVTLSPLDYWWATGLAGPWNKPKGDVLIVLGGSVLNDGTLGESSYWRSVYATRAYREGQFHQVVLSGMPAAEAMKSFLVCQGVPPEVIRLETRSTSTRENALFTTELLTGVSGRLVLLTSDYHMFRAHHAFGKIGLDVVPIPYPDVRKRAIRWTGRWPAFLDLVLETFKIGYYFSRGLI